MKEIILKIVLGAIALLIAADVYLLATSSRVPVAKSPEEYGSIVRLVDSEGDTFCSGTVVAPTVVLTAAHCVIEEMPGLSFIAGYRQDITIRPSNNKDLHVTATVYTARVQMDHAFLRGDFRKFKVRPYLSDPEEVLRFRDEPKPFTACGYPLGGDLYCATIYYKSLYNFMWKTTGPLIPGMSGGPVFNADGAVVGTNTAMYEDSGIVSPTYNIKREVQWTR